MTPPDSRLHQFYIIAAFAVIYLVWGSTYLANYWALDSFPPFLMTTMRFLTAGSLLYLVGMIQGVPRPTKAEWWNGLWLGFLFMGWGVGAVVWSEQYIDTGMVALIISSEPLIILFMIWGMYQSRPDRRAWVGVVLGIIGTFLLIGQPQFNNTPEARMGVVMVFLAITGWSYATIKLSKVKLPKSKLRASSIQMICGGLTILPISLIWEDWSAFSFSAITLKSGLSWLYLVFMGSILAFTCFNFLLNHVAPEKVATATYVHPVVAMFLGWSLNDEFITPLSMGAGAMMLVGVFLINSRRSN